MIKPLLRLAALLLLPTAGHAAGSPPNIIFMIADDLGYRDLSCYGAEKISTPRIDSLAKDGLQFTDAHSISGICMPSRYAILSGTYFHKSRRKAEYDLQFHEGQVTLPAVLKSAGYRTAALGKWHNGFGRDRTVDWNADLKPGPLEIGFDSFFGQPRTHSEPPFVFMQDHRIIGLDPADPISVDPSKEFGAHGRMVGGAKAAAARPVERIDLTIADKAAAFLQQQTAAQPFFLYLAFAAPHNSISPAPEFRGKSKAGAYGDFIQQLDHCAGVVLDALEKQGLTKNTLVIFTSDNGGRIQRDAMKAGHRSNGELLGQKTDGWEGGHRVPFLARWPGHIPAASQRKEFFLQLDVMATLAEAAAAPLPAGASPDGASELAAFINPASPAKRTEAILHGTTGLILRQGDWVFIPKQGSSGKTAPEPAKPWSLAWADMGFQNSDIDNKGQIQSGSPTVQLYNLREDLTQSKNLALEHPDRVQAMQARLKSLTGNLVPQSKTTEQP
jgi:arylsulfatase A